MGILIISSEFWLRSGRLDPKSRVAQAHQIRIKEIGDSNLSMDSKAYMVKILAGLNKFEKGVVRMKWLSGRIGSYVEQSVQIEADDSIDISKFR